MFQNIMLMNQISLFCFIVVHACEGIFDLDWAGQSVIYNTHKSHNTFSQFIQTNQWSWYFSPTVAFWKKRLFDTRASHGIWTKCYSLLCYSNLRFHKNFSSFAASYRNVIEMSNYHISLQQMWNYVNYVRFEGRDIHVLWVALIPPLHYKLLIHIMK